MSFQNTAQQSFEHFKNATPLEAQDIIAFDEMLVSEKTEIILQKSYLNVSHVFPAYGNTFALLARRATGIDVFVHFHKNGKIFFEEVFQDPVDTLALLSEKQAIILLTRKNSIRLIELQTQQKEDIKMYFMFQQHDQSQIHTFNISRLFCISQQGLYGDHRLKLTYFDYPLTNKSKPIAIYESKDNEWTYEYLLNKGNEKSLMLWWKPRQLNQIEIKSFKVDNEGKQIKSALAVINSEVNCLGQQLKMQFAIGRCWELNEDKILLIGLAATSEAINLGQTYNLPMVLDHRNNIVRQFKVMLPREMIQCQIDQISFGMASMLRSFRFLNGHAQQSSVCYINNELQEIIVEQKWQCSHKFKFFISGYQRDTLIECQYQNNDVQQIIVTRRHTPNARMLALHFLIEICEDFDDDLLKEAVQFLPLYGEDTQ